MVEVKNPPKSAQKTVSEKASAVNKGSTSEKKESLPNNDEKQSAKKSTGKKAASPEPKKVEPTPKKIQEVV